MDNKCNSPLGYPTILILSLALIAGGCDDSPESSTDNGNVNDTDTSTGGEDSDTTHGADSSTVSCASATTIEECESMVCLPIPGRKANLPQNCYGPEKIFIQCVEYRECQEAEGFALDPETSECYKFPTLCMPEGWTVVESDDPNCVYSPINCST